MGQRRGFANLKALAAALKRELEGGEMKQEGEERLTTLSEDSEKIRSRIPPVRNSYDL
jgi:uncharacterized protein YicC (UPF0701 family)